MLNVNVYDTEVLNVQERWLDYTLRHVAACLPPVRQQQLHSDAGRLSPLLTFAVKEGVPTWVSQDWSQHSPSNPYL